MKFYVTILVEDRKERNEFDLPSEALISDLRKVLAKKEGVEDDAAERINLYFKTASGHNLGVEDDEKIVDSIKEPGELQAKFIGLAFMDGTVKIDVEPTIVGDVSILMGGTKFFEHYLLNKMRCILKVPKAKAREVMKGVLPFKLYQNKIAIVEKENQNDYIAMQYLIENDWNLVVTKCDQSWQLQQKLSSGQLRNLVGIRKVYYEKCAKNPKC